MITHPYTDYLLRSEDNCDGQDWTQDHYNIGLHCQVTIRQSCDNYVTQIKRKVNVKASYKLNKALLITTISNKTFQAISAIVAILRISGLIYRVWQYIYSDVSEQHAAYIFRVTKLGSGVCFTS